MLRYAYLLGRVQLFATPWIVAHQAPLSEGSSRQEYQSELPFPLPGDIPNPGIKPWSPALQPDSLLSEPPGKSYICICAYTYVYVCVCIFPDSSVVKNPPAMQEPQEMQVQALGQVTLEECMATHSSILTWRIPWTEESGRLQSIRLRRVGQNRSDLACIRVCVCVCVCVCVQHLNHFAVYVKLTQHCKLAIFQLKMVKRKKEIK